MPVLDAASKDSQTKKLLEHPGANIEPGDAEAVGAGLDALETTAAARTPIWVKVRRSVLPPIIAIAVLIGIWQLLFNLKIKPDYILPSPATVWATLTGLFADGRALESLWTSLERGVIGFAGSVVLGSLLGLAIARNRWLRSAIGPLITGLQSLPSIAWVPPALLWFGLSNTTYYAVILLGAVPSVANGLISGINTVPPLYTRVGEVLGLGRWGQIRHVLLPAALPGYLGGLRQGWAFSWRSLMAAELIVTTSKLGFGLGQLMDQGRSLSEMDLIIAAIFLIFAVGVGIELLFFRPLERWVLKSRGLSTQH